MRRLTILVACWKRPALTRLMLEHTRAVAGEVARGFVELDEIDVLAIVSPDEDPESRALVEELAIPFVCAKNSPLGAKWGRGMKLLEGHTGAVMILGSDDFLTAPLLRAAFDAVFRDKADVWGVSDFRFIAPGPRALYWPGYSEQSGRQGEPMGAARAFSARLLDILKWTPWPADLERGLDGACWKRVHAAAEFFEVKIVTVPTVATGGMIVDVKRAGDDHLSQFEDYINTGSEEIDWRLVTKHFSPELIAAWDLDPLPEFKQRQLVQYTAHEATPGPRVSLAMIAKDAEATIERAIRCALPVVDAMAVIVDQRSNDATFDIAVRLGADVVAWPWQGFAGQRNVAHELAKGSKFHLILDSDETLDLGDLSAAIDEAEKTDSDGVSVTTLSFTRPGQVVPIRQVRVVRAGRTRWRWKRHNELVGADKVVPSSAVIRNSYAGRMVGIAAAAIPELEMMYAKPSEEGVTADEEKAHAAVFLARSFMGIDKWNEARIWARLVPNHLPPDHLKCVMAGIVEAWATLFLDGPVAAEEFTRAKIAQTPGVAEYRYLVGSVNMMSCVLDAMDSGRYALIPQGCLAHVPNFPMAFQLLGFPFQISFDAGEEGAAP